MDFPLAVSAFFHLFAVYPMLLITDSSPAAAAQDLNCNVKIEVVSRMFYLPMHFSFAHSSIPAKPDFATLEAINLTPLEQWIIGRVRDARQDGISAADGFRRLRNRCLERERRELNLMARELDLVRRLNEIHNLSKNVE